MYPRVAITKTPMLRAATRQPAMSGRLSLPLRNTRNLTTGKSAFDGPGGQSSIPKSPMGGSDIAKRNWRAIGGGLAVLAGLAYFMGGRPKKDQMEPVAREGERGLKKLEEHARNAAGELSGKKPGGMGGFRSE
ncbi:unnamed protein product [Clonostachys rosea f. rosea IK726]|uniref:Uncharacterized protein n=1 Tax=Clonostachys rosea f. rosea IK726 TaxID=1349383 RepID=A0ACA9TU39_BIOOC|nr:unnamed protein product [Clonostachys rosea f. rosea IK726]